MALSSNCWKYLVLTFNVLFAMSAIVLFGASGFLLYRLFVYRHFIGVNVEYPAILLLMMAIITCSIAWIGWRTAKSMHQIHVIMAGILILLVVVIEFVCFVWAMVVWDNIEIDIKTTMTAYFLETSTKETNPDSIRWDRLHVKFECCGVSGPADYSSTGHVPFSCCGQGPLDSIQKPYTADCTTVYQRGCGNLLHVYAKEQLLFVAMVALIASVIQSTGIFCTFFLAHAIKEKRRASIRTSTIARESTFAAPDDSLLASPTAPAPTLPKY
ncbi:23 kDa integral membrane protein [Pieris rapae]|uniref:23 kDa integral membrane protein n=1 Tax=Pieris rapae TaxID=64459 RepID=UPI000B9274E1|nr:23 kDa integral membrane protein [Pieris rapae]